MREHFVETPHLAIIHLLRSQGQCGEEQPSNSAHVEKLKQQTRALKNDLALIQQKIMGLPCAVSLEEEVARLEKVVVGLRCENDSRRQEGFLKIEKTSNLYSTQSTDFLKQQSSQLGEELFRYRNQTMRLEEEHRHLMQQVKKTHNCNEEIVGKYGKADCSRV